MISLTVWQDYAGKMLFSRQPSQGTISQIAIQLPQVRHGVSEYHNIIYILNHKNNIPFRMHLT